MLPMNLVEAGYAQLQRIPGNQVPTVTSTFIQGCSNPTFSTDGTNTLANNDPMPPACDKQGPAQCATATANSGTEPLVVSVPATGSFTLTVATGTVTLAVSGSNATGALTAVTVSDTRNTYPGWSVSASLPECNSLNRPRATRSTRGSASGRAANIRPSGIAFCVLWPMVRGSGKPIV